MSSKARNEDRSFFGGSERAPNRFLRKNKKRRPVLGDDECKQMTDNSTRCVICEQKGMKKKFSFMITLLVKSTELLITAIISSLVSRAFHENFF